ncbi:MAG: helix-turn-helix transcriptional regulator [Oscillospiraceae bacterium]|nr:helix-turn-helix transcriptional regulator [Oscillospiraceae bacterium]
MDLDQIIRTFREENNLSMQEFADRCALSKGYISMLEKGHHPQSQRSLVPSIATYKKLSAGMGMTLEALFSAIDADAEVAVNIIDQASTSELTQDETQLISDYRSLNEEGKTAVRAAVSGFVSMEIYKKRDDSSVTLGA